MSTRYNPNCSYQPLQPEPVADLTRNAQLAADTFNALHGVAQPDDETDHTEEGDNG